MKMLRFLAPLLLLLCSSALGQSSACQTPWKIDYLRLDPVTPSGSACLEPLHLEFRVKFRTNPTKWFVEAVPSNHFLVARSNVVVWFISTSYVVPGPFLGGCSSWLPDPAMPWFTSNFGQYGNQYSVQCLSIWPYQPIPAGTYFFLGGYVIKSGGQIHSLGLSRYQWTLGTGCIQDSSC